MYKNIKKSILSVFLLTLVLFLFACEQEVDANEDIQYEISFNTDGGNIISPLTLKPGDLISSVEDPTKDGYAFSGWEPVLPELMPNYDLNLTAVWTIKSYTIVFNTDGGSVFESIVLPYLSDIDFDEVPIKEGYTFKGWDPALPKTMPLDGIEVVALWEADIYTITFDTDGGALLEDISIPYLEKINYPEHPKKLGYTFLGWDKDLPEFMPLDGLTLTAQWEVNTYEIKFNSNGGTLIETIKAPYGEAIHLPNAPDKLGYIFKGWDQVLPEFMPLGGLVLNALWEKEEIHEEEILTENFDALKAEKEAGYNFSSYEDFDYMGQSYVVWDIINGRIDLGMKAGGDAITLSGSDNDITDAGMGRIYAEEIHDGIQWLEFDARLPFSPKSTYPQRPGKDKARNVYIKVYINDDLVASLQFADDDEANKGKKFIVSDINVVGTYSLSIEVSSGHRLTVDNIRWMTHKNGRAQQEPITIDFENDRFDFAYDDTVHQIGGIDFMTKEVHTLVMHPQKELDYMDKDTHGAIVARFRGLSNSQHSTETAYMYNIDPFDYVAQISFDARLFGEDTYFTYDSKINIYYKTYMADEFILIDSVTKLNTEFTSYTIDIDKSDVHIKIEVVYGSVNLDNIQFQS